MITEAKHIFSSFQTLFMGDLETYWFQMNPKDLFNIINLLSTQILSYFFYKYLSLLEFLVDYVASIKTVPMFRNIFGVLKKVIKTIPVIDGVSIKLHTQLKQRSLDLKSNKIKAWRNQVESSYWKKLFNKSIKNTNAHIRLVITGDLDTEGNADLGNLRFVLSNHRSIFDYILLQYIFQNKQIDKVSPNYMLTWGRLVKIPGIRTMINIFKKNENYKIKSSKVLDKYDNNTPVILFPEVNVMTKEVKIIHDKLCVQEGTRIFKETLSPRYDSFLKLVGVVSKSENIENEYFFNVTLTYYKLEAIPVEESTHICLAHKKETSLADLRNPLNWYKSVLNFNQIKQAKIDSKKQTGKCKYQLLQIIPSLFECFYAFNRTEKQPLIIRVHIEKIPMLLLKDKSKKKLELFLENKFAAKDDIINQFESSLKVKKSKKRSLKNTTLTSVTEDQVNTPSTNKPAKTNV